MFLFRDRQTGKLREMGLGSAAGVTLAQARHKARAGRDVLNRGEDPIATARVTSPLVTVPTFAALADEVITSLDTDDQTACVFCVREPAGWEATFRCAAAGLAHFMAEGAGLG